jgi:ABC-type enterochelin transport system permease subunit
MLAIESIGKSLILFGIILIVTGSVLVLFGKVPWFGRLPGDIIIKNEGFTFYFPVATMILLSIALTILFNIIGRR